MIGLNGDVVAVGDGRGGQDAPSMLSDLLGAIDGVDGSQAMPRPLRLSPGIGSRGSSNNRLLVSSATTHSVRASWSLRSSAVHQSRAASSMGAASWTVFFDWSNRTRVGAL